MRKERASGGERSLLDMAEVETRGIKGAFERGAE